MVSPNSLSHCICSVPVQRVERPTKHVAFPAVTEHCLTTRLTSTRSPLIPKSGCFSSLVGVHLFCRPTLLDLLDWTDTDRQCILIALAPVRTNRMLPMKHPCTPAPSTGVTMGSLRTVEIHCMK